MKKLFVIVGPTAVGKTNLAIHLAKQLKTEIVSADARQLFKEMKIGTARPTVKEMAGVAYHFVGTHSIHEKMSAGEFGEECLALINEIFLKKDELVLCGGSGLYIKATLEGFDVMPEVPDKIRTEIVAHYQSKGLEWLQNQVEGYDPEFSRVSDIKNPQRLMRALELYRVGGGPLNRAVREIESHPFEIIKIGLTIPRGELYKRIDSRVDSMIDKGLFEEAKELYSFRELNALQTVGYQEIFDFMNGAYDQDEAVRLIKRNSRRYAKRQLTWFRKDQTVKWFDPEDIEEILNYATTANGE